MVRGGAKVAAQKVPFFVTHRAHVLVSGVSGERLQPREADVRTHALAWSRKKKKQKDRTDGRSQEPGTLLSSRVYSNGGTMTTPNGGSSSNNKERKTREYDILNTHPPTHNNNEIFIGQGKKAWGGGGVARAPCFSTEPRRAALRFLVAMSRSFWCRSLSAVAMFSYGIRCPKVISVHSPAAFAKRSLWSFTTPSIFNCFGFHHAHEHTLEWNAVGYYRVPYSGNDNQQPPSTTATVLRLSTRTSACRSPSPVDRLCRPWDRHNTNQ